MELPSCTFVGTAAGRDGEPETSNDIVVGRAISGPGRGDVASWTDRLVAAPTSATARPKSADRLRLADRRGRLAPRRTLGHRVARTIASPTSAVAARLPLPPRSVPDLPLIVALARVSLAVAQREEATLTMEGRRPAGGVSSLHDCTGTSEGHS